MNTFIGGTLMCSTQIRSIPTRKYLTRLKWLDNKFWHIDTRSQYVKLFSSLRENLYLWRHDTQNDDIQQNDTQNYDIQHDHTQNNDV